MKRKEVETPRMGLMLELNLYVEKLKDEKNIPALALLVKLLAQTIVWIGDIIEGAG